MMLQSIVISNPDIELGSQIKSRYSECGNVNYEIRTLVHLLSLRNYMILGFLSHIDD